MYRLIHTLRTTKGAIDLASIMVGIIVIGIIGGVIAATVFAVVPWTQDNAAKGNLSATKQAEHTYSGLEDSAGKYTDADGLASVPELNASLLKKNDNLKIYAPADGSCYLAASKSDTGRVFWTDNRSTSNNAAREFKSTDTSPCGDVSALVAELNPSSGNGGDDPAACTTKPWVSDPSAEDSTSSVQVALVDDQDGNGQISLGDTVHYTITTSNPAGGDAKVLFPVPFGNRWLYGSLKLDGERAGNAENNVLIVPFNGTTATVEVDAVITDDALPGYSVSAVATVENDEWSKAGSVLRYIIGGSAESDLSATNSQNDYHPTCDEPGFKFDATQNVFGGSIPYTTIANASVAVGTLTGAGNDYTFIAPQGFHGDVVATFTIMASSGSRTSSVFTITVH